MSAEKCLLATRLDTAYHGNFLVGGLIAITNRAKPDCRGGLTVPFNSRTLVYQAGRQQNETRLNLQSRVSSSDQHSIAASTQCGDHTSYDLSSVMPRLFA